MKIVFTGGGTGGHFYPLIAIAESMREVVAEKRILPPTLYYLSDTPYDEQALFKSDMVFVRIPAGKLRRYFSLQNIADLFKTLGGVIQAFFTLLKIYPDVVISKGGYASVPTVIAAGILRIPIIIHESDAKPGRANIVGARFATRIAVAFDSAIAGFGERGRGKIARVGIPVRTELLTLPPREEAVAALALDPTAPTILIVGGSSGSMRINETVLDALPELVSFANVIHQTGKNHFEDVRKTAQVIIAGKRTDRYHPFPYLSAETMREAAAAADVIVGRAGATTIIEIALWGVPAILIPIPESISHDQRTNAYAYARTGAAVVLEEANLSPHVLASEARRISSDPAARASMREAAGGFANRDAGRIIAEEALRIGLSHEKKK